MTPTNGPSPAPPVLERASLVRELDEILSVCGVDRETRLLESPSLGRIVALMPPEELFFTLKGLDPERVPEVLSHARSEQVQFLLDLELWRRDHLRVDRLESWLRRLIDAGPLALARWLRHLDLSTWTLILGNLVKIRVATEDADPFQEAPGRAPFTLEGLYYVSAPSRLEPDIRSLLLALRESDAALYGRLLESLLRDVGSDLEEHCFEEKQRRLAERGFPEWEEAYGVYARLRAQSLDDLPRRPGTSSASDEQTGPTLAPRYAVSLPGDVPDLLARALHYVREPHFLEAIRADLAHLTNKVLVADGLDTGELDSFYLAIRKVVAYVSIGLETLCGIDENMAAVTIQERWLQHLFRVGWTEIRAVQSKARRFLDKGWPAGKLERLLFLDPPLPEILDGLQRRHPLWYCGEEDPPVLREFRTLSEVRRADKAVGKAEFLGQFLLSVVDFHLTDLKQALVRLDAESFKGRTVFLTALVNAALGRDFRFAPVERQSVRLGLDKLWEEGAPPRRIPTHIMEAALTWARTLAPIPPEREMDLREFVTESLALLEEEFGHLATEEIPDPRFTKGLWIV